MASNAPKPGHAASGCLILFGIPFAGIGLFFAIHSLRSLDNPNFKNPWIGVFAGSTFALIGALIVAAGFHAKKTEKYLSTRKGAHPTEPWLWRDDWAEGRATGRAGGSLIVLWVFTVLWNGMAAVPVTFFFQHTTAPTKPMVWVFLGLFPLIGLIALIWAIRQTVRVLRFGRTFLQLQTLPAPLGGKFRGTIDVRLPYPLPHGIQLAFTCVNRVSTGTGEERSTSEYIRWQEKKTLDPGQVLLGPQGATIPVEFDVPRDMPPSDSTDPDNQTLWLVRAQADVPGVKFDDTYEVPVFETRESPTYQDWHSKEEAKERIHPPTAPIRPTVHVSPAPEGGTQFYFPAGRNTSAAFGVTFFLFFFGVAEALIFYLHAPLIFPIFFGVFVLLLFVIALNLWFGTARIVATSDRFTLRTSTLGLGSSKQWATSQILDLYLKITMQSGGAKGTAYYTVMLTDTTRRSYQLGNALADHNEAEWICAQLRQMANLETRTAATP